MKNFYKEGTYENVKSKKFCKPVCITWLFLFAKNWLINSYKSTICENTFVVFDVCLLFFVALNTKEKRARGIRSAQRKRMSTIRWNVSPIVHIGMSHVGILYIP